MSEPVEPEDEITESIPRKKEEDTRKSEWEEWMTWFFGGF